MIATKQKLNPFGMVKRAISPERKNKLYHSLQHMAVMAELIKLKYRFDMDADFKDPVCNNLANKIGEASLDLAARLRKNNAVEMKNTDPEFLETYSVEIYRAFDFFIGLPADKIAELINGWEDIQKHVAEHDNLNYITIGLTQEEVTEVEKLANRKGLSEGLKTKLEAVIREVKKE